MIRIYCQSCDDDMLLYIEPMQKDQINGSKIYGDLMCSRCKSVIATITVTEPGVYEFQKVRALRIVN